MEGHDTLVACLSRALTEEQLVSDIAGTCALSGITMKGLASGQHTVSEISSKLFLTEQESVRLLRECLGHYQAEPRKWRKDAFLSWDGSPPDIFGESLTTITPPRPLPLVEVKIEVDDGELAPPQESASPPTSPRLGARDLELHQIPVSLGETPVKLVLGNGLSFKVGLEMPAAPSPAAALVPAPSPPAPAPQQLTPRRAAAPLKHSPMRMSCPAVVLPHSKLASEGPSYLRPTATGAAKAKNAPETVQVRRLSRPHGFVIVRCQE